MEEMYTENAEVGWDKARSKGLPCATRCAPLPAEKPNLAGQIFRVASWRRNRKHRRCRVKVNRRHIKLNLRLNLPNVKPGNAGDRLQHGKLKLKAHPLAPGFFDNFDPRGRATRLNHLFALIFLDLDANLARGISRRRLTRVAWRDALRFEIRARVQDDDLLTFAPCTLLFWV